MRRKPLRGASVLAVAALVAAGCSSSAPTTATSTVEIGLVASAGQGTSGGTAPAEQGAQLAVDLVNGRTHGIHVPMAGAPGIASLGGAHLDLVVGKGKDDEGQQVSRLVKDDGVVALAGVGPARDVAVTSERAERLHIPYVGSGSSRGFLTHRGLEWFFHTGVTDTGYSAAFLSLLSRRPGASGGGRIAVLHSDDADGSSVAHDVASTAQTLGFDVVDAPVAAADHEDVVRTEEALTDPLTQGVDGLVLVSEDANGAMTAAEATSRAVSVTGVQPAAVLGVGTGFDDSRTRASLTHRLPGMFVASTWSPQMRGINPVARAVANAYRHRYGHAMTAEAAAGFTSTYALARAVEAGGSAEPRRVQASLLALDIPGRQLVMPWDNVRFDAATHQNMGARAVVDQLLHGGPRLVEPQELARSPVVWTSGKDH